MIATIFYHQKSTAITQPRPPQFGQISENSMIQKEQEPEMLHPINNEKVTYSLQNNELNISFDQGANWQVVPVKMDQLFGGEYQGNKQELITDSYLLTENVVAFLYVDGAEWENESVRMIYSKDQGATWKESVIADPFSHVRFRIIDFVNDRFGYAILSGDRTMSQEFSQVYVTNDGGEHWGPTTNSEITRLIAGGGFVDEETGFLSYGTINPEAPDLYVTQDGGKSWHEAMMYIPEKYKRIFVIAETPIKEGDHLAVLVNQGPNGDYAGGLVKGKFISTDHGATWEFAMEVQPDEME
nr:sialidase family protein [Bacillus sp. FJAT-50079]